MLNIRTLIEQLRRENQIVMIDVPVDPKLELAEVHRRVIAEEGPALLFTNPVGSDFPVVTNLFGTRKRVELAFGTKSLALMQRIAKMPERLMPPSIRTLWGERQVFKAGLNARIRMTKRAPVLECVQDPPELRSLPILTCWPDDGGPFVTLPLVYTEHPETGVPNLGMYRLQRFDDAKTGYHCQIGKGGGFHLLAAQTRNEALPVNVFLGGPPAMILAAIAPLPENVPELLLAGLIQEQPLGLCKDKDVPLPMLSEAEFVLVGTVDPNSSRPEGPFGDHYGYYSLEHPYPVFECKRVYHRKEAIYPATVVGKPRQEDFYIGDYLQELLSPLFPLVMPGVTDLWSYGETGYHSLAAAVVKERYKREAMVSAFRILGEGQLSLTKFLIAVDRPQSLRDFQQVLEYVLARADFRTDLYLFSNLSMDTLDYTGPEVNRGSKGVLLGVGDPIRELPGEFTGRLPRGCETVIPYCRGCLVVSGPNYDKAPNFAERVAAHKSFADWPLVFLVDNARQCTESTAKLLWTIFTRFEPGADIFSKSKQIIRNHIAYAAPIVVDARMKPSYPPEVECDPATAELVTKRWKEYFKTGESYEATR